VFLQLLVLPNATSFVCSQIRFGKFFFFGTMVIVLVKETRLVVAVDDLDFKTKNVIFETKMFNRYGTFDRIANRSIKYGGYTYLHYDLLDMATLTTIILRVKLLHKKMHEQHLHQCIVKGVFYSLILQNFSSLFF
jgi:hypothetical protein